MDGETEAELRRELEALREELARLREQVADARGRVRLTMREQRRCAGCGEGDLLHATRVVAQYTHEDAALCVHRPNRVFGRSAPQGVLGLYACRRCGLTEWYVRDPTEIDLDAEHVTALEAPVEDVSPYR